MKPKDVTDTVLGQVELAKEKVNLADRRLRLRRLVVQPGGVVPWHSHEDRPALIYVVSGTIYEYASNCAVPIEHKTGEVSIEKLGVQHWWKNTGKSPVVLLRRTLSAALRSDRSSIAGVGRRAWPASAPHSPRRPSSRSG